MAREYSLEELQQMALSSGATLTVGGKVFNSGGRKAAAPAPRPAPPAPAPVPVPPPAPAPPAGLSRAEVVALLAERDSYWKAELDRLILAMPAPPAITIPAPPPPVREWVFEVEYGFNGAIKGIKARAAKS